MNNARILRTDSIARSIFATVVVCIAFVACGGSTETVDPGETGNAARVELPEDVSEEDVVEALEDALSAIPWCVDIMQMDPGDVTAETGSCRWESSPNTINGMAISACSNAPDRQYVVFDRETGPGTWFGLQQSGCIELDVEEYTVSYIDEACAS